MLAKQRLLLVFFLISVSAMLWLPETYANSGQLKVGDQWTVSGTYENALTGSGKYQGNYNETGPWSEVFSVASVSDSLTISAIYQYTSSEVSSGYYSNYATTNGQHSYTALYVINQTSLAFISSSEFGPNRAGHPNWLLVNASALVAGGTVPLTWFMPSTSGEGQVTVVNVPWKVTGNQQVTVGSSNLQIWGITYSGNSQGSWSETNSAGQQVYAVGPETEIINYDSVDGLFVGTAVSGTYHLSADEGAWNETDTISGQISSSNISFGSILPTPGIGEATDFSLIAAGLCFSNRKQSFGLNPRV
ncbi:MAG: hypothetical protein ACHQ03_05010 [Candidatus Bathyarchaeia archaeon]